MTYDYRKLEGRIVEVFGTRKKFAEKMDISERSLSLKLNNKVPWNQPEIDKAIDILDISDDNISLFFFTQKFNEIELPRS